MTGRFGYSSSNLIVGWALNSVFFFSTGMSVFLKNTTFHGILLDSLFDASSDDPDKKAVVKLLSDGLRNGAVRPLQTTVFSEQQVEQAFRYAISFTNVTVCNNRLL